MAEPQPGDLRRHKAGQPHHNATAAKTFWGADEIKVRLGASHRTRQLRTHLRGLDLRAVHEALRGGFADSRIFREHGLRMIERNFEPGGPVTDQIKDLDTILAAAATYGLNLPISRQVREMYLNVERHEGGRLDHSALLLELERINPGAKVGAPA